MKNTNVELSYILLFVLTCIFSLVQTLEGVNFPGELYRSVRLISDLEVIILSFINIMSFIMIYFIYLYLSQKPLLINKRYNFNFNINRSHHIFFIILVAQVVFLVLTGVGRLSLSGDVKSHVLSPIFAILKPDTFILVYYVIYRSKKKISWHDKLFIINLALYSTLKLLQGWTAFILIFFILEVYCHYQDTIRASIRSKPYKIFLLPFIVVFIGGLVYQYMFVFKNEIRGNKMEAIGYLDGVKALSSRLSMNPISIGAYQNLEHITELSKSEDVFLKESKSILRSISPSFLFDKNYRTLNNTVLHSYTSDLTASTSSDFGIIMYTTILYNSDGEDFLLYCMLLPLLVLLAKLFFDSLSNGDGSLNILLFLLLFKVVYTASLENVFGYGFIPNIFLLVVFLLFKGVTIDKKTTTYTKEVL